MLSAVVLIAVEEILGPRGAGGVLRRTPIVVITKTSANGARHAAACGGGVTDRQVPGVTTELIEFVF